MQFKQYPSYKNSGVEWLGDVPEHWEVKKIKRISSVKRGASPRPINDLKYFDDNGEYAWVRISDVTRSNGFLFETEQRLSSLGASFSVKLEPESLFLSIAATVGKPCITKIKTCIHDGFVYFPKLNKHRDLLFNIFESKLCFVGLGKLGTQLNLNSETVEDIYVAIPPESEEKAILGYIQTETTRIDNLIAKQEKLIELLEEQRKSIISHAVTKGLNPNAPMKDSGVEWLGEVPKHWSYSSLKYVLKQKKGAIKSGPFGSHLKSSDMVYSDVKVINQRNVIDKDFIGGDNFISFEKYEELKSFTIYPKDVLVTTRGTIGKVAQVAEDLPISILHPCLIRIQVDENKVLFDYINYFFECEKLSLEQLRYASNAATIDVIYCENLASIYLPIPSISEQNEIIKYLKDEDIKINKLISKQKTLIEKLKEYRASIISHAVTGKIDVREFGA